MFMMLLRGRLPVIAFYVRTIDVQWEKKVNPNIHTEWQEEKMEEGSTIVTQVAVAASNSVFHHGFSLAEILTF